MKTCTTATHTIGTIKHIDSVLVGSDNILFLIFPIIFHTKSVERITKRRNAVYDIDIYIDAAPLRLDYFYSPTRINIFIPEAIIQT